MAQWPVCRDYTIDAGLVRCDTPQRGGEATMLFYFQNLMDQIAERNQFHQFIELGGKWGCLRRGCPVPAKHEYLVKCEFLHL